jgi:metal-responsive CopG/Arc/MetJ family transcriptional regulator
MVRTQIQLEEEMLDQLRHLANERACSISEIVRLSVKSLLAEQRTASLKKDSLALAGKFHSGVRDLAKNHDEYLKDGF